MFPLTEKMTIQDPERQPLIKRALSKIHTLLYPYKRQGFFTEDPSIEFDGQKYSFASFNRRILSSGIDMVITSLFSIPIGSTIASLTMSDELSKFQMNPELIINDLDTMSMLRLAWDSGLIGKMLMVQLVTLFIVGCYAVFFWVKKGATPGKMLFKCKVVDSRTYEKLSLQQAILRFTIIPFSILPALIGLFMIDWTKNRQALHDKVANTVVVYQKK